MEYEISKMIANKKKYIFRIVMAIFILIAITISIIGSFAIYQYDIAKKNFVDNEFAKTIEISSFNEQDNQVRKLNGSDIKKLEKLLVNTNHRYKIIEEHQINFGIQTDNGNVVFVKSFSGDFFVGSTLKAKDLITKKRYKRTKLSLNIPVIKTENGGYTSDTSIKKEYNLYNIDEASILNNYIKEDELIVSEATFKEIFNIMFPENRYIEIEKIYINVESIEDIRDIAKTLSNNNYNVNHAFEYYDDLDTSVEKLISLSVVVLLILLIFTVCFLTGLFELMLKNSVGDIAALKHLGYTKRMIAKIYLYPMVVRSIFSLIIICISNIILYKLDIINSFRSIIIFQFASVILCILALIIMYIRIKYYSSINILLLIKKYKVEE
ncbi:TPA: hypothetical protein U1003_000060 [Streptococcus suis]|nr:hypothetical protein [Streptococcus suis]